MVTLVQQARSSARYGTYAAAAGFLYQNLNVERATQLLSVTYNTLSYLFQ